MPEDQREVIEFLSRPASYGSGIERVDILETHISLVFLAGERAYKLKRAVIYSYVDFSTVERRRRFCEAEIALNRRTASGLYLELRALVRRPDGSIGFAAEGEGPAIDWVVVMQRFDQALLFDALARNGGLNTPLMRALAEHIAAFHMVAERRFDYGGAEAIRATIEENDRCLAAGAEAGFSAERRMALRDRSLTQLAGLAPLLDRRRSEGKVRLCHGDLHLRNICLLDGKPTLFDCIEFCDALAAIDVLYDLAFLLMDLEHRGLSGFANLVLNRYLDLTGEEDGLAAMPLFLSLRAAIRAHVSAAAAERAADRAAQAALNAEAGRYLDLAIRLLQPRPRRLVAVGGVSGTGKSTLAAALAGELGARVLRSDVIRKRLCGVSPETPLPATAYTRAMSEQVYGRLRSDAAAALAAGYSVIVDAVALRPEERRSFAAVAEEAAVPFAGLWLEASPSILAGRIRARRSDASDASEAVLAQQLRHDPGPIDWTRIDAAGGTEEFLAAARQALDIVPGPA